MRARSQRGLSRVATRNDHESFCACAQYIWKVVDLDSADAEDREAYCTVDAGDVGETDRGVVRLCRRREQWPEADVISALAFGSDGLVEAMR